LDAFVSADGTPFEELAAGSRIGTGSPRRKAQVLARRPDLTVVPLRGNLHTRLRKIREEDLSGTILAHAGLRRMGREACITQLFDPETIVPAVGQGAVAVCARRADRDAPRLLSAIDDPPTRIAVEAERSFLKELRGGCQAPAGALATADGDQLRVIGVIAAPDGSSLVRGSRTGSPSARLELGRELAADLLDRGGREILNRLREVRGG
jgi:hydroxymethylbilane synthase